MCPPNPLLNLTHACPAVLPGPALSSALSCVEKVISRTTLQGPGKARKGALDRWKKSRSRPSQQKTSRKAPLKKQTPLIRAPWTTPSPGPLPPSRCRSHPTGRGKASKNNNYLPAHIAFQGPEMKAGKDALRACLLLPLADERNMQKLV